MDCITTKRHGRRAADRKINGRNPTLKYISRKTLCAKAVPPGSTEKLMTLPLQFSYDAFKRRPPHGDWLK
jgi:hypothetical protein